MKIDETIFAAAAWDLEESFVFCDLLYPEVFLSHVALCPPFGRLNSPVNLSPLRSFLSFWTEGCFEDVDRNVLGNEQGELQENSRKKWPLEKTINVCLSIQSCRIYSLRFTFIRLTLPNSVVYETTTGLAVSVLFPIRNNNSYSPDW